MIEVAAGVRGFPVRSPTLPPATHTNVWILGTRALTVIDPASPWPEEQQALWDALQELQRPIERILLTHHHHDHISGALDLQQRCGAPIVAHPATVERLGFAAEPIEAGPLDDLVLHHTPGHAPGHLVVLHPSGACVAGDMVAGIGTIAIDPDDDGHLGTYLASLEALLALQPRWLLPAHGPVLDDPQTLLTHYLQHRHARTEQIREALTHADTPIGLAPHVYTELDPRFHPLAAVQIRAHLIWLHEQGQVRREGPRWLRADEARPDPA